jgi:hypothetical protein
MQCSRCNTLNPKSITIARLELLLLLFFQKDVVTSLIILTASLVSMSVNV